MSKILPPKPPRPLLIEVPDGTLMGDREGNLWRIFRPRWWEVRRWSEWFFGNLRKGTVDVDLGGRVRKLRAVAAKMSLPGIASAENQVLEDLASKLQIRRHP
jgi:hypothetical protein